MAEYTLVIRVEGQDAASAPLQSASGGLAAFGAAADGAAAKGGGFFSNMAAAAGGFLAANVFSKITEGIVGLGVSSIQVAQDFEAATATFASVAGGSLAQAGFSLEDVKNKALDMGAQTAFSAAQAQEAMIALAKGGVPIADVMGAATDATLALASAGELGLGPAADIVAKQLGVWGSTGVTAAQVADQLAQAANASTVDVDELALGLANVGGVAKASGVSFLDLNTTMAMIAPGFSSASDAGTSLKSMILALQPTTAAAKTAMAQLGLATADGTSKFYDAQGSFVGMEQAAAMLQGALGGMSEAQQSAALKAIFGTDAYRAASIVVNQGAAGFNAMGDAMTAAGSATEQAAIRSQTFKFAWDSLLGTIETIQIVIGSALLPILTMLVNSALIPAGNAVLTFVQSITSAASPMGALVAMVDSVIPGFASFVDIISANLMPILAGLGAVLVAVLVPSLYSLAAGAVAAAVAFAPVVAAALLAAAPFVALGLAVAALYAAFQSNFLGIQQIVQPVIDAVIAGFSDGGIGGAIAGLIGQLDTFLPQLGAWFMSASQVIATEVLAWGAAFIGWVAPMIPPALAELGTLLAAVGGWIVEQAPALMTQFLAWGQALLDWVAPYIPPALAALAELASSVLGWIGEQVGPLVDKFMEWASALIEWIGPAIPPAIAALSGLADSFFGWIGEQVGPLVTKFAEWAGALVEWIVPATVQFLAAWPAMLDGFLTWIGEAVGPLLAKLGEWALAFIGWIAPMIPGFLLALAGIALALGTWIVETVAVIAAKIVVWGGAFLGWVATDVLPKLPGILGGILSAIGSFIGGAISWLANEAAKLGKGIIDGVVKGLGDIGKIVGDKIKAGLSGVVDVAKKALGIHSPSTVMAEQVGSPIVEGIAMGIKSAGAKATGAMLDLASKLIDVVDKGVGAFGKLAQLGTVPRGAVQNFADAIKMSLDVFSGVVMQWDKAAMSAASQFTKKAGDVVEMMSKGLDFLLKLDSMRAIPVSAIHNFASALQTVMNELIAISTRDMRIGLMAAVEFAVSAGKILESIGKGVDGLTKLGSFTAPAAGAFIAFRDSITQAVGYMLQVTRWFSGYPVSSAVAFAESAGKIITMIGAGVDSFKKLTDFAAPSAAAFQAFRDSITQAVGYMVQVAGWFANYPVGAAVSFATSAGQIIDVIGKAVDNLKKLSDFAAPAAAQFVAFRDAISNAVGYMVQVATWFAGQPVAAAVSFADSAGKIISILGTGVDAFAKLGAMIMPGQQAFLDFFYSLTEFLNIMISASLDFEIEGLKTTQAFSEAAAKIVGILGSGVDAFTKLGTMVMPGQQAFLDFFYSLTEYLNIMLSASMDFEIEGLTAAAKFAESAGKIIGILGTGVDAFLKLSGMAMPGQDAFMSFFYAMEEFLNIMLSASMEFEAEGLAVAAKFAESAGKVIGILGSGVDGFAKLAEIKPVADGAIATFVAMTNQLVSQIAAAASSFNTDALAVAAKFAETAGKAVGMLKSGVDGFQAVDSFAGTSQAALDRFGAGLQYTVNTMIRLSGLFQTDALAAAKAFGQAAQECVDFLKKGVDGLKKLAELDPALQLGANMNQFATGVVSLINTLIKLSGIISSDMLVEANRISVGLDNIISVLTGALKGFGDLANLAGKNLLGDVAAGYTALITEMLNGLRGVVLPSVAGFGPEVVAAIAQGLSGTQGIAVAIQNLLTTISTALSSIAQQVVAPSTAIGQNIAIGIANGIVSQTSAIVQAMIYAVQAAINAANSALGIASPSKVFKNKVGVQISAGMAEGVLAGAPQVQSAISGVSGMALGGATGGGGGGGSVSIVFQPGSIVQQPGEDMAAFADRVAARVVERSRGRR